MAIRALNILHGIRAMAVGPTIEIALAYKQGVFNLAMVREKQITADFQHCKRSNLCCFFWFVFFIFFMVDFYYKVWFEIFVCSLILIL